MFVLYQKLVLGIWVHRNPVFMLSIMFSVISVQFLALGLLAEMVIRTYFESQHKPAYLIGERWDSTPGEAMRPAPAAPAAGRYALPDPGGRRSRAGEGPRGLTMCGIAGYVQHGAHTPGIIERMTARLAHRGPDGGGTWCGAKDGWHVALGTGGWRSSISPAVTSRSAMKTAAPDHLQRRGLQLPDLRARPGAARPPVRHALRHRGCPSPPRGIRRRRPAGAERNVRPGAVGPGRCAPAAGARPGGDQAAVLRAAAVRRGGVRVGTVGAAAAPGGRQRDRPGGAGLLFLRRLRAPAADDRARGAKAGAGGVSSWDHGKS